MPEKVTKIRAQLDDDKGKAVAIMTAQIEELEELKIGQLLTDNRYRALISQYDNVFAASMGAEAVLDILQKLDLDSLREKLQSQDSVDTA